MKSLAQRGNSDFYSGLLLVVVAVTALLYIRTLTVGTVLEMGPGYFPLGLALVLLGMGLVMIVKGLTTEGVPVGRIYLRPLFFILLSFAAFGLLVERAGLMIAILVQVALAHFASRETTWLSSAITAVALAIASSVVFVWLLKIPVSVLP
ncbi:Tripartite tricarboxylate transporter TctB family protein [Tardiphaga sp. OK246]|jgi:putative tricarboxylic transport membrane protein|uniref:tripartite tricarboxylate transporter TctB family protein n=1 Tax=Tardiphaga sp. OK246 TaxID=1855307 RepID=UPI000B6493F0|nr:tripartite tricarboxylate transporter TctB family protein [Tardiphaga sp. OK246]SNS46463.1 Tripartite tricarboxylate transporter TctB family protein [Tardiphaga sp. OK246]